MRKHILTQAIFLALGGTLLTGCGGGSSDTAPPATQTSTSISGQVVDSPIAGASVCLLADGKAVLNNGAELCSAKTDQAGNYTLAIPSGLVDDAKRLTLIATKDGGVKLVSSIGTMAEVKAKAKDNKVTMLELPASKITHLTTSQLVLMDTDKNNSVSAAEASLFIQDYQKLQELSALIKAVIDYGKGAELLTPDVKNTLDLIRYALDGTLPNGSTLDIWYKDPNNQAVIDVSNELLKDTNFMKSYINNATLVARVPTNDIRILEFKDNGVLREWSESSMKGLNDYTGRWEWKSGATQPTININPDNPAEPREIIIEKINGNTLSVNVPHDNNYKGDVYRTVPFTTAEISGKSAVSHGSTLTLKADGTSTFSDDNCISKWKVENGVIVLDFSNCPQDDDSIEYMYKLSESTASEWQYAGRSYDKTGKLSYVYSGTASALK